MAKRRIVINILPIAIDDLNEIVSFISRGSVKYARLEKQLIIKAIEKLYDFPEMGRPFDYKNERVHQMVFRNYLIIYRFKTDELIEILTIHHHARSLSNNPAFNDED